ncbi:hypothetical protein ACQ33O_10195 [Ferruginibacter sp. SUN002]|uniref:hypothetical protein n=1 Tax=Ferruginibacter sp. SUN002 TaxID=2937789 RepID=UPI003D366B58
MRLLFVLISLLFWGTMEAQNLDSARHLWQRNELGRALDLILEDTTATTEAWLLKAKIYQSISVDAKYKDLVADPKKEAFEALKTAYADYPVSLTTDSTAYKIYEGYTNDGVAFFNAGTEKQDKTDYARALKSFKKAADVMAFINRNKQLLKIDTTNLLYSAKAAIYAEDEPEAFYYSKRIADLGIRRTDFEPIYQWLLYHYRQKGESATLMSYTIKFVKAFPRSNYGYLNLIDFHRNKGDLKPVLLFYHHLIKNKTLDEPKYKLTFCQDLFNYLYTNPTDSLSVTEKATWVKSLESTLKDYLKTNKTDVAAKLLFGKFYINKAVDTQKEKPGTNISSFLIKSNAYLKEVADRSPKANKNLKIEAVKLLIGNYKILKQPTQVRRYNTLLKKLTTAIVTILIILLYLT